MKALRSLERKEAIFSWPSITNDELNDLISSMKTPTEYRLQQVQKAMWAGASVEKIHSATKIDPWYLHQIQLINEQARLISQPGEFTEKLLRKAKGDGFSDAQIASLRNTSEDEIRNLRHRLAIRPVFKTVDTCAAEFEAFTPYFYSSYEEESEVGARANPAVIILGSGPNRIGQGIEFDY